MKHLDLWGCYVSGTSYDWVLRNTACRRFDERVERWLFVRLLVAGVNRVLVGGELL